MLTRKWRFTAEHWRKAEYLRIARLLTLNSPAPVSFSGDENGIGKELGKVKLKKDVWLAARACERFHLL